MHTQSHMHTCLDTDTQADKVTQSHMHACMDADTQAHTVTRSYKAPHAHSAHMHTCKDTDTQAHTQLHSHTGTHAWTQRHTQSHSHACTQEPGHRGTSPSLGWGVFCSHTVLWVWLFPSSPHPCSVPTVRTQWGTLPELALGQCLGALGSVLATWEAGGTCSWGDSVECDL